MQDLPKVGETWRLQYPGDIEFTRVMKIEWEGLITILLSSGTKSHTMSKNQVHFIERIKNEN